MRRFIKFNRQYVPIIMVLILGIMSAVASFYIVRYIEFLNIKAVFIEEAQDRTNAVKKEMEISLAAVQSLKSFYQSSMEVTRDEFHEYSSQQLSKHPSIRALEWIPRVSAQERNAYELSAQTQAHQGFQFTEMDVAGAIVRAGERREYFPVYFVEPFKGNEAISGFDLASDPIRQNALHGSRDSGEVIATAQIELVREQQNEEGFLVIIPVYRSHSSLETIADRRNNLRGFVSGVFEIKSIVEGALSYLQPRGIYLSIYDKTDLSESKLVYTHISRMRGDESRMNAGAKNGYQKLSLAQSLDVANRKWVIVAEPIPAYFASARDWHAWGLSLSILFITFLITYYMGNIVGKNARIQNLVKELSDDVNERKRVEGRLQEAHKRLLTVLDGIDSLVYVADMQTYELLFINKYGREIWGDIQGSICWKVLQNSQTAPCDFCTNRYLLDSGGQPRGPYVWEFQNTVNGHWYYIIDRAIRWIDGRLVRLEIASDITERKTLEEERQRSHKLESVGILAGGIAHDFNNLLTAIMNNIYVSKGHIERGSNAYNWLEEAEKAIMRASQLTRQLLAFAKGGAPVTQSTAIAAVLQESSEFVLRGSNARCEFGISEDLWPVEADAGQISQVFQNIMINADQSMPEGGIIKITAKNAVVDEGTDLPIQTGQYVKITIQDQGTGISEEYMDKIFDPYFTTKETGRGLGLAITFAIIKNHGGHISVESEAGRGTTFTLYLPASGKETVRHGSDERATLAGKGKILIMDDDDMVRHSLGEMIATFGYTVEFVRDGQEAIEYYARAMKSGEPFNAVILDLTVPGGMGGEEAIRKLREIDPHIVSIVSSGYSNDRVLTNFREYGFSDVIVKPYKAQQLKETLVKALQGSSIRS